MLVEVVVAFAVATVALLGFYEISARHAATTALYQRISDVNLIARNHFAELATRLTLQSGHAKGSAGDRYEWTEKISKVSETGQGHGLFRIELQLWFLDGRRKREFDFETLRIAKQARSG